MSGDLSLFGDDEPKEPAEPVSTEAPIADWLVDQIREALTAHGVTTMGERQQAIEAITGRPVDSLRSLTRAEAMRVLSRLAVNSTSNNDAKSSWDSRDEDTWIDRL